MGLKDRKEKNQPKTLRGLYCGADELLLFVSDQASKPGLQVVKGGRACSSGSLGKLVELISVRPLPCSR